MTEMSRSSNAPEAERLHALDLLRGCLMILGIPFHASLIYAGPQWLVNSPNSSTALRALGDFIHVWRMPAFFVIAGYFALLMIRRKGSQTWLKGRLVRLGIPLVVGLAIIIPLQALILAWADSHTGAADLAVRASESQTGENWVSHLWFLIELLGYCVLLAGLSRLSISRHLARGLLAITDRAARSPGSVFVSVLGVCVAVVSGLATWDILRFEDILFPVLSQNVVYYMPFFAVGAVVALRPYFLMRMLSKPSTLTVVLAAGSIVIYIFVDVAVSWDSSIVKVGKAALLTIGGVYATRVVFALANFFSSKEKALVRWLVDSSLVVYITHHPFVLLYGAIAVQAGFQPLPGFVVVTVLAFICSGLTYEVVATAPLVRFLLMGSPRQTVRLFRPQKSVAKIDP